METPPSKNKRVKLINKKLLLPREKYAEGEQKYGVGPNALEITNGHQLLCFFGANHSHDPSNFQYPMLRKCWKRFLGATRGKERIVLVEGWLWDIEESEEEAIKRGSEGSFIALLAHRAKVPFSCPDLSDDELVALLPHISKEGHLLYYYLTCINNGQGHKFPASDLKTMKVLYKKIMGEKFDGKRNVNHMVNPNLTETPINLIARARSDLRDQNIASEIVRYWKEGKSIFAVFGKGHLVIQEPALRKLLI